MSSPEEGKIGRRGRLLCRYVCKYVCADIEICKNVQCKGSQCDLVEITRLVS